MTLWVDFVVTLTPKLGQSIKTAKEDLENVLHPLKKDYEVEIATKGSGSVIRS